MIPAAYAQVGTVEERLLRAGDDRLLLRRWIRLGEIGCTRERLRQCRLDAAVHARRDLRRGRGRISRGQERAENRLHDGAAEVALEIGRT